MLQCGQFDPNWEQRAALQAFRRSWLALDTVFIETPSIATLTDCITYVLHVTKQSNDWLVVWQPSQRCRQLRREMFASRRRKSGRESKSAVALRQSKNAKNRDELRQFVFSPVSRAETTLPLRETSLKAFDYFIEAFHFFLQSYIKDTLFICELFAVASESRLKPTFFDLPPIRVLAGGISDAFSVFFPPFFFGSSMHFCPSAPHATDSFAF